MDSNSIKNTNSSSMQTSIDRFFPATSATTSPHFLDATFLNDSSSWAHPAPEQPTARPPPAAAPGGPTGRPSRKRSRASRRAPTTVLTTDTSNFRAMVQEFTGIPSPPFASSASLHFPRPHLGPPPSFLLSPFHHHFQPPSTSTSPLPTINFQSLLQSQVLNMPQQQQQQQAAVASASSSSSSGELRLPGVIGSGAGDQNRQQQQDATASCSKMSFPGPAAAATEFRSEKGAEGLMDSWICSSD
ncbi:putative basic proline-rich protein-like [Iris pallida]|uniref:Basic proline-rich protein-like n=1 Tax=Iris pallida TaxID=29817 RepID=A0AAX6ECK0_IRIPA|nr:putative basic proline-rich protein-like [Iris pallida]